jgi:hypothetical protein|tara:strand:- start:941 stop:1147 length:207 start_codon:yes stop_codon:yes gene_type:complete
LQLPRTPKKESLSIYKFELIGGPVHPSAQDVNLIESYLSLVSFVNEVEIVMEKILKKLYPYVDIKKLV